MSAGIDIELVKERYSRMADEELIRVSTQDAFGLTPEAIKVVKAEILKRNLSMSAELIQGIDAQNKECTEEEIASYCNIICRLHCPNCGSDEDPLNATMTGEVRSFVFFTQYKKRLIVACPSCLDKANNAALIKTSVMGWWGIPWGIIQTLRALNLNWTNKLTNHVEYHNQHLHNFVVSHIGAIEAYKDDEKTLQQVLMRNNQE